MRRIRLSFAVMTLALLAAGAAFGQEPGAVAPAGRPSFGGALVGLLVAVVQLIVALSIAAFAINQGLKLLSKLLTKGGKSIDIWAEIKNKNSAVALLGAGVVISYCNVIGSGIQSMSNVLGSIAHQTVWQSLFGLLAALVNLVVAIGVASFAITVVFKIMDRMTSGIDEAEELKTNNTAIGIIYCGIIIGVSFLVSSGVTSIGMGVSAILNAVFGGG